MRYNKREIINTIAWLISFSRKLMHFIYIIVLENAEQYLQGID